MKYNRFVLNIELGNDSMRRPQDVAYALREAATRLCRGELEGNLKDINGNTVGDFAHLKKPESRLGRRPEKAP